MSAEKRSGFSLAGLSIRHKLMAAFTVCILGLGLLGLLSAVQFYGYERDLVTLLDGQMLFYEYQEALTRTESALASSYGREGAEESVRANAQVMRQSADAMAAIFPGDATHNLAVITANFTDSGELDTLTHVETYRSAASELRRRLGLIKLQYGSVSRNIHDSTEIKRAEIKRVVHVNLLLMLAVVLLAMGVCVLLSLQWAQMIVDPINRLVEAARNISWDRFDALSLPNPTGNDEIGYLLCAFSEMAERLKGQRELFEANAQLEQRVKDEHIAALSAQKVLRESELMILQAEINPHFLFNSMNLLRQMAFLEQAEQTGEIVEILSEMLRYSLSCMHRSVTLGDELENVRNYFYIQNKRFDNAIEYQISVGEDALLAVTTPSMIIQPLVENSYKYCRKNGDVGCFIGIEAKTYGDRMRLVVRDNGIGMTPERLEEVRAMIRDAKGDDASSHIGLRNVMARLRVFYSDDVNYAVESEPGTGTTITVDIPRRRNGEEVIHEDHDL